MSDSPTVQDGMVVAMLYTLTDGEGTVIDASGDAPLYYLQGYGNIVPGLERQIAGASQGDKIDAVVPPEEGYGEKQGPGPQGIARTNFPADVDVQEGMMFQADDGEGNLVPIWVVGVQDEQVFIDTNHPLAGVTLHFAVELTEVRPATAEEKAHGHVHGPGGHHH